MSVSSAGTVCRGDECVQGGAAYCAQVNRYCSVTQYAPCFRCTGEQQSAASAGSVASHSFGSASPFTPFFPDAVSCTGRECETAAPLCDAIGLECAPIADLPCFRCADTDTAVTLRDAFVPADADDTQRAFCETDKDCPPDARCVQGFCLMPHQWNYLPAFCGNARLDPGEQCDDGMRNSNMPNASCRPDCTPGRCGDGIVDAPAELCDDGNRMAGDGCSPLCTTERTAADSPYPGSLIDVPFAPPEGSAFVPGGDGAYPPATSDTGPAAIAVMAAGAAAGWAWVRRRRR